MLPGQPALYSIFAKFAHGWTRDPVELFTEKLQRSYEVVRAEEDMTSEGAYEAMVRLWPPKIPVGGKWLNRLEIGDDFAAGEYKGKRRAPIIHTDTEDEVSGMRSSKLSKLKFCLIAYLPSASPKFDVASEAHHAQVVLRRCSSVWPASVLHSC